MADLPYARHVCSLSTSYGGQRSTRGVDAAIAALAERQHGVVAMRQLRALDISARAVERRLAKGSLHPLHRGVYAIGHRALTVEGRWMAAVLACGGEAVLSHRSAARLWRLLGPSRGPVEVMRTSGWRGPPGVAVHRSPLPEDERAVIDEIPVTTVPRTLLDLAAILSPRRLERALNETDVLGLTDRLSLPHLLERYPRRQGTAALRAVLGHEATAGGITRNDFEEAFVALLDANDLPRPRLNAHISVRGRFFEVDAVWDAARLAVELDGRAVHGTRLAFEADRERDRLLLVDGWRVMRVTWHQLCEDGAAVAADLRRLLGSAPTL